MTVLRLFSNKKQRDSCQVVTRFPTFRSLSKSGAMGKWSMAMKMVLRTMQMVMPRSTKGSVTTTRRKDLTCRQQPQQFHCRRTVAMEYQHGGQDLWSSSKPGDDKDFQTSEATPVNRILMLHHLCFCPVRTLLLPPIPSIPLPTSYSSHSSCTCHPLPPTLLVITTLFLQPPPPLQSFPPSTSFCPVRVPSIAVRSCSWAFMSEDPWWSKSAALQAACCK